MFEEWEAAHEQEQENIKSNGTRWHRWHKERTEEKFSKISKIEEEKHANTKKVTNWAVKVSMDFLEQKKKKSQTRNLPVQIN